MDEQEFSAYSRDKSLLLIFMEITMRNFLHFPIKSKKGDEEDGMVELIPVHQDLIPII